MTNPSPSPACDMLLKAASIVDGARQTTHGDRERSFGTIAALWSAYLCARGLEQAALSGHEVAEMMVLLKVARAACGEPVEDHYIDMAGYAALAGELASGN